MGLPRQTAVRSWPRSSELVLSRRPPPPPAPVVVVAVVFAAAAAVVVVAGSPSIHGQRRQTTYVLGPHLEAAMPRSPR